MAPRWSSYRRPASRTPCSRGASRPWLTLTTLLASSVLLVPLRDPALLGALTAVSWLAVRYAQRGLRARDPALSTTEGRIALALPYLPAVIVAARAMLV